MPINMGDQFKGLPMADLIGAPLQAACDAQVNLAQATANFIQTVGFVQPPPAQPGQTADAATPLQVRQVDFKFSRPRALIGTETTPDPAAGTPAYAPMEDVTLSVPLLAIVKIPSLAINTVDIVFDMEVKNSESSKESEDKSGKFSADTKFGWGPFSVTVHVEGSVATHKENTRQTDQSAKYHVEVHAEDKGMPEGLARVLDMMNSAIAPKVVTPQAIGASPAPAAPVTQSLSEGSAQPQLGNQDTTAATLVASRAGSPRGQLYREVRSPGP